MPKKETVFEYKVTGFWPFPIDMLRRDGARASSPEDQTRIDMLTGEPKPDTDGQFYITLYASNQPARKRWKSFNWSVVDSVYQVEIERPYTDEEKIALLAELAEMRKSADEQDEAMRAATTRSRAAGTRAASARDELRRAEEEEAEANSEYVYARDEHKAITQKIDETLRSLAE